MIQRTINKKEYITPRCLIRMLEKIYGRFDLDPATTIENPVGTPYFYTKKEDGLKQKWFGNVYVNPPYGKDIIRWIEKAVKETTEGEADKVIMLLPARTDTKWFHKYVLKYADEIIFLEGRMKFVGTKETAPFPSIVVVFRKINLNTEPMIKSMKACSGENIQTILV